PAGAGHARDAFDVVVRKEHVAGMDRSCNDRHAPQAVGNGPEEVPKPMGSQPARGPRVKRSRPGLPEPAPRREAHCTTNVIRMLTRHSVTLPSPSVTTLTSLTQAPWMPLTVSDVFFRPDLTASSTLVFDDELISMTLATDMVCLPWLRGCAVRGTRRLGAWMLRMRNPSASIRP